MKKFYNPSDIKALSGREFLFDANALIYVFWPSASLLKEREYSSIFNNLLKQKNKMHVDFLVISEVINRVLRIEYEKYLNANNITKDNLNFKTFRNNADGQQALNEIYNTVKSQIFSVFSVAEKAFTKDEITKFLNNDSLDFNDKGIYAICRENNFILVTNDRDFLNTETEILSSNPLFFRK
ncbi:MAG TPA: DUF5615 family PIN-like protein [bacterium]|nr:DUF5615 family PIN-like protein [bacterium]HPS29210.1 DUF5615 family PIN-like protein [bacterium]